MKTVICLIPFSDGVLSMYKGEIASIDETKATALIASGYVAEYSAAGGGGVLVVTDTDGKLDKTWQEIKDAFDEGEIRVELGENNVGAVLGVAYVGGATYGVCVCDATERTPFKVYFAESASSYPSLQE